MKKRPLAERFWEKVRVTDPEQCWEWQSYLTPKGYGVIKTDNRKSQLAHRVAWQFTYGPIENDLCCLHRCNNARCVNPGHLFLGTREDNNLDRKRKGRGRGSCQKGEHNHHSRLTWQVVEQIRELYRQDRASQSQLGRMFGVTQATVSRIVRYKGWAQG